MENDIKLDDVFRRIVKQYVQEEVQEAVLNALIALDAKPAAKEEKVDKYEAVTFPGQGVRFPFPQEVVDCFDTERPVYISVGYTRLPSNTHCSLTWFYDKVQCLLASKQLTKTQSKKIVKTQIKDESCPDPETSSLTSAS